MSTLKLMPLIGVVLMLPAGAALAQAQPSTPPAPGQTQTPAPAPKKEDDQAAAVADVVVTARANDVRTSIDAVSYSLADDLQAATGTLAEALRNVPSIATMMSSASTRGSSGTGWNASLAVGPPLSA